MPILRRLKTRDLQVFINDLVNDERLSFDARGLMAYLAVRPDNWKFNFKDLFRAGGKRATGFNRTGNNKIYNIVKELQEHGYINRVKRRCPRTHRFTVFEYQLRDGTVSRTEHHGTIELTTIADVVSHYGGRRKFAERADYKLVAVTDALMGRLFLALYQRYIISLNLRQDTPPIAENFSVLPGTFESAAFDFAQHCVLLADDAGNGVTALDQAVFAVLFSHGRYQFQ